MPWFKVDDTLAFHQKSIAAGNAAMGLWVRAGSWSMQTLSDGFIPTAVARQLGTRAEIRRLVDARLWEEHDGGFTFHEWGERQPSKSKVTADRAANAERIAKWRRDRKKFDEEGGKGDVA